MTDEERQRQMDFIVNHQAEFSVRLDRLGEKVEAMADAQQRSDERWARTEDGIRSLLAIAEIHEREIADMKEEVRENNRIARQANEAARAASEAALAASESGRVTDERLNALIIMVEKYLSERRNGRGQGEQ